MNTSIFWAGTETSPVQQSMTRHMEGTLHISADWAPRLLQMGL